MSISTIVIFYESQINYIQNIKINQPTISCEKIEKYYIIIKIYLALHYK